MSGSTTTTAAAAASSSSSAFAPVFVAQFGGGVGSTRGNNNGRKNKRRQDNNWHHVCDSLLRIPLALSSSFSLLLLIFVVILCSIVASEDVVKGREISSSSLNNYNGLPKFDVNDLKNLIEIFPEFREYVLKVVSSHVEKQLKQQQPLQYRNVDFLSTTTAKSFLPLSTTSGYTIYNGETPSSHNSRKDFLPWTNTQQNVGQDAGAMSKHSYGWSHNNDDDDNYHPHYDSSNHDHGYGYGPTPSFGWTPGPSHHYHEPYKDPKFHYHVGYQLGKDVSCVLGLLGFKSIKDFSIHKIFSLFKKLKYLFLIGLAFKLGVILSPIALPMLFPIILLAMIAKILPLILIIFLLFKLLKTQLKLGIGRRVGKSSGDIGGAKGSDLLEGTTISRLWQSIEDVTQSVTESEACVEKIICKMIQRKSGTSGNKTFYDNDDNNSNTDEGTSGRSMFSEHYGIVSSFISSLSHWIFPTGNRKLDGEDSSDKIWECDEIPCSFLTADDSNEA